MKIYTLKLKTASTTNYSLYDGTTLVSDADLTTLFTTEGEAYFTIDLNSLTPTNLTSLTIVNSSDTAVMTNTGLTLVDGKNFKGEWGNSATSFTSFTQLPAYGLDESQLSSLVSKIRGGKIRTLTTADYNWNSTTKTATEPYNCVAPWLLDYGIYILGENMSFSSASDIGGSISKKASMVLMVTFGSATCPKSLVEIGSSFLSVRDQSNLLDTYGCITWFNQDGTRNRYSCLLGDDLVNNLSNPAKTSGVLAATTGKTIKDSIGDITTLTTTTKTSLTAAINELVGIIGNISTTLQTLTSGTGATGA